MPQRIPTFDDVVNPLNEGFLNLSHSDEDKKREVADKVWDMLQKAYEKIGGIHGNGFQSKEDMIKNIHFWKVGKSKGQINSVVMYKDKGGRKRVAAATDGTPEGKNRLGEIVSNDYERSYGEMSGPMLSFTKKHLPPGHLTKHAIPYKEVASIAKLSGDVIRKPPEDDPELKLHPELKDHFYQREIGGHWHTKAMFGTPGKKVI